MSEQPDLVSNERFEEHREKLERQRRYRDSMASPVESAAEDERATEVARQSGDVPADDPTKGP